ncbi:MAG: sigma-54 dependent transcriptional regulator [Sphingobacteriales bacterium JAD_PAG50586_3]|nr:MAG: sigma-54 dependent transcriptional regulator [Sphingobacteriales bacterium JAD_PAG50586_3]
MTVQDIKQRFGILGNSPMLDRALETAYQVAATDMSVLITGESGVGKEVFSKIIHNLSPRKHSSFIAVNCGAIPEGTIDSELFGHEKGSFTGANEARKGYFEVADGGTIFLDEVAELPLLTQVRLLRVLESGEFIRVGSSKVQKTQVRVVAATNVNIPEAVAKGKFREDLYYRLNTVPIFVPSLRERKEDIPLIFRKFAADFAEKYKMPSVRLDEQAQTVLVNYRWPGNIRQLKNVAEQISILEKERNVTADVVIKYLPDNNVSNLPALYKPEGGNTDLSEREILYKVLFDMKRDISDLKKVVADLLHTGTSGVEFQQESTPMLHQLQHDDDEPVLHRNTGLEIMPQRQQPTGYNSTPMQQPKEIEVESLSLQERELELIKRALDKNKGRRRNAAKELGISERTLYRKIKEYNLE